MSNLEKQTFGFFVSAGPMQAGSTSALNFARAAVEAGHKAHLFLMHEGVYNLARKEFRELAVLDGASISVCRHNAEELSAPLDVPGVNYGSQYDNATLVGEAGKYLAFTD